MPSKKKALKEFARLSKLYSDAAKTDLDSLLDGIEDRQEETAEEFHLRLCDAVWDKVIEEETDVHPVFRCKILKAIAKRPRYRKYAISKLVSVTLDVRESL